MQTLTLDDLERIRNALNTQIHSHVMKGAKEGANLAHFSAARQLAETRDKIQSEIDARTKPAR